MRKRSILSTLFVLTLIWSAAASAAQTHLTIRARAHDAKFIGSGVGGMDVAVYDAVTGALLASGRIEGGTGNTNVLMKEPAARGQRLSNDATAAFVAAIDIYRPTKVKVVLRGPLAAGNNVQEASRTLWVLPGQDITGDGIVFDIQGFLVYPVSPAPHQFFALGDEIPVEAQVGMMCGCPIKPDGLWDANRYAVKATVERNGEPVAHLDLAYAGSTSRFRTTYRPEKPGNYRIVVTAADPATNNFGVGVTSFVVTAPKKK